MPEKKKKISIDKLVSEGRFEEAHDLIDQIEDQGGLYRQRNPRRVWRIVTLAVFFMVAIGLFIVLFLPNYRPVSYNMQIVPEVTAEVTENVNVQLDPVILGMTLTVREATQQILRLTETAVNVQQQGPTIDPIIVAETWIYEQATLTADAVFSTAQP